MSDNGNELGITHLRPVDRAAPDLELIAIGAADLATARDPHTSVHDVALPA